jgi:hypothetical protein
VPTTHVGPEQQPPLHPVVPAPHAAEQVWVVVLHASPVGQSVGALQPHTLVARHECPATAFAQLAQTAPLPPH